MKKIAKKTVSSTKKFVRKHKFGIAATTLVVLQARAITRHNDFLKDKDLFDEFYKITEQ